MSEQGVQQRPSTGSSEVRRRGRRSSRGREKILAAAAVIVARRGAENTRFTDVSQASGVPVSSLQYYFGNREDLLVATFRHECARETTAMAEAVAGVDDPWEQLSRLVRVGVADGDRSMTTWHTWVEFWRAALRDDELREEAHAVYRRWREIVAQVVSRGMTSGRFRSDLDVAALGYQVTALVDGIGIPVALADPDLATGPEAATGLVLDAAARLLGVDASA